jgi:hypothetical protein
MVNKKLRAALLATLDITPQALSQRVQKIKTQYPVTTEDAVYMIAQQQGIILSKYLDNNTIDRVRDLLQQAPIRPIYSSSSERKISEKKTEAEKRDRIIIISKEFTITDPILPEKKNLEAKDMAKIYPLLYIMENSIREVIDRVMTSKHGSDWWDSQAPRGLSENVNKRMADEKKNSWHQRRGSRPIDYLDMDNLPSLVRKIDKDIIPSIIPSVEWFTQFIDEIYRSRCVICHMNPLDDHNIQAVKLRFRQWQKLINEKKNIIP